MTPAEFQAEIDALVNGAVQRGVKAKLGQVRTLIDGGSVPVPMPTQGMFMQQSQIRPLLEASAPGRVRLIENKPKRVVKRLPRNAIHAFVRTHPGRTAAQLRAAFPQVQPSVRLSWRLADYVRRGRMKNVKGKYFAT